jgi:hypothetical protein
LRGPENAFIPAQRRLLMADPKLVHYIQSGLKVGQPLTSLKRALVSQGWDKKSVDEAANEAQKKKSYTITPKRPILVTFVALIGMVLSGLMIPVALILFIISIVMSALVIELINSMVLPYLESAGWTAAVFSGLAGLMPIFICLILLGLTIFIFWSFLKLWKMERIGWLISIILTVLGLVTSLWNGDWSVFSLALNAGWVGYLWWKRELFV